MIPSMRKSADDEYLATEMSVIYFHNLYLAGSTIPV